jgi:hypothetical protein
MPEVVSFRGYSSMDKPWWKGVIFFRLDYAHQVATEEASKTGERLALRVRKSNGSQGWAIKEI